MSVSLTRTALLMAAAMKARMNTKRRAGWSGWEQGEYPARLLRNAAKAAVNNDVKSAIDCANFCMMTWLRHTS